MARVLTRPAAMGAESATGRVRRIAIRVHQVVVSLLAIHVLMILVTGGYRYSSWA